MLGTKELKDQVKAGRAKATGTKTLPTSKFTPKKTTSIKTPLAFEASSGSSFDAQQKEQLALQQQQDDQLEYRIAVKREEDESKVRSKIDGIITKKVEVERNRRLRCGEGPMNKKSLAMLKASLRIDAERKYLKVAGNSSPDAQSNDSGLADREMSDVDSPISAGHNDSYLTGCEASHVNNGAPIKFNLGNRSPSSSPNTSISSTITPTTSSQSSTPFTSTPNKSKRVPISKTRAPRSTNKTSDTSSVSNRHPKPKRKTGTKAKPNSTRNSKTSPHKFSYVSEDDSANSSQVHETDEDKWWQAEEAKWKEELKTRREQDGLEGEVDGNSDGMHTPAQNRSQQQDDDLENDICLKTQIVIKMPTDQGLGVQLYTPKNEHGVRITKIVPNGPFGRTNSFDEGDVIVEINGIPLLYAGHESVFETIKTEMMANNQMSVTVCSPEELLKLEALVKNENEDEGSDQDNVNNNSNTNNTAGTSQSPSWKSWTKGILTKSPTKTDVKSWLKPMLNVFDMKKKEQHVDNNQISEPTGPTSGTLKGAPAWWKDSNKRNSNSTTNNNNNNFNATTNENATDLTDNNNNANLQSSSDNDAVNASFGVQEREPAYLIYRADIRDLEAYKAEYMSETTRIITKYGGRWLARGGKIAQLEGKQHEDQKTVLQRMVLIEFPNIDAATDFFQSEEYQAARNLRLSIAAVDITVLEGIPRA